MINGGSMVGQSLGHYKIRELLGKGGMGEVYLAEDTELGRKVALKVLPGSMASSEERLRRFRREAKTLASLNHPNIVTVFSVESTDGVHFLTMELLEGRNLAEYIPGKGVSPEKFLEVAIPLADALSAAHEGGVIHRDLKPSNIIMTASGVVKVVDFGLAKLLPSESSTLDTEAVTDPLTGEGRVLGTVPYMSPEQLQGGTIDERSDIFSVGIILYQLATGDRPFKGTTSAGVISSILRDVPTPVDDLRAEMPHHVGRIVNLCLEKDPELRIQSAKDLRNELSALKRERTSAEYSVGREDTPVRRWRWLTGWIAAALIAVAAGVVWFPRVEETPAVQPKQIAIRVGVLPLRTLQADGVPPEWSKVAQAMISSELVGARMLTVIDPLTLNDLLGSSANASGGVRPTDVYESLVKEGLDLVVDGTIMPSAGKFLLMTNLVDPATGSSLTSLTVPVESEEDLAARTQELSERILGFIEVELLGLQQRPDLHPWVSGRNQDTEAVQAFLQAADYIYRYETGAGDYLRRAIQLDPEFISARVWLISGLMGEGDAEEVESHYQKLLELAPSANSFEQAMIRWVGAYKEGDLAEQAQHLEIALDLSPGNQILLFNLGFTRYLMHDCVSALEYTRQLVEAQWSYPPLYVLYGTCLVQQGEFDLAKESLERSLEIVRPLPSIYAILEGLSIMEGDLSAAEYYGERLQARSEDPIAATELEALAATFDRMGTRCLENGRFDCAVRLLERSVAQPPVPSDRCERLARAYIQRGQLEDAKSLITGALNAGTEWPEAYLLLGEVAKAMRDPESAISYFERFLEFEPEGAKKDFAKENLRLLRQDVQPDEPG